MAINIPQNTIMSHCQTKNFLGTSIPLLSSFQIDITLIIPNHLHFQPKLYMVKINKNHCKLVLLVRPLVLLHASLSGFTFGLPAPSVPIQSPIREKKHGSSALLQ